MQICSWYTEHDKPLPGLYFDLKLISSQMSYWSLVPGGANTGMEHLDGKKWGKVSGQKGKAKQEKRGHCRLWVLSPPSGLPTGTGAQAGPAALEQLLLELLEPPTLQGQEWLLILW